MKEEVFCCSCVFYKNALPFNENHDNETGCVHDSCFKQVSTPYKKITKRRLILFVFPVDYRLKNMRNRCKDYYDRN